ncbi:LysR family transcriptional regulator YeiE [plant metagenome]|uniref:LysR family transcriptional regulator YeiE n=1 Tax=plant metagenome TaxID=1297885 RepID=A0A484PGE2_9ZZZZ
MHLTLRQLEIFVAIAETGSTSAASQRIALSQSAVSGALRELEHLLDTQLFDRLGKRLSLNDTGRALLPQALVALEAARDITRSVEAGAAAGGAASEQPVHLCLGASTTIGNYLAPAIMADFLSRRPQATLDLFIGNTREVAASVARLEIDLGLIEGPCHDPSLRVTPWQEDELVVVCAPGHPLAALPPAARTPQALRAARWLLREAGSGTGEAAERILLPQLDHFERPLRLGSTEAIKQAAAQGLGLACLSRCAVEDLLALGRLTVLDTSLGTLSRRLYLVRHPARRLSPGMQAFLACCGVTTET